MVDKIVAFLGSSPDVLVTFILGMLPISELRGAIPYGIAHGMSWQSAFAVAVVGNFIPVIPILYFIGPVSEWLRRYPVFNRFFDWLFARTRRKGAMIERFELLGLMLFVGVPLPVTGAWTGCLAAFIFGVRKPVAILAILGGILLAGGVVTLASTGVIHFIGLH